MYHVFSLLKQPEGAFKSLCTSHLPGLLAGGEACSLWATPFPLIPGLGVNFSSGSCAPCVKSFADVIHLK